MRCIDIANIMEKIAPTSLAESWDNVGLIMGNNDQVINKIMIALDATEEVVLETVHQKCDMLITHHPFIYSKINRITNETPMGRKILMLLKNNISVYSAHTNLDKSEGGVCDILCNLIGLTDIRVIKDENGSNGFLRIGKLPKPISISALASNAIENLQTTYITSTADKNKIIETVAVASGSGMSLVKEVLNLNADLFITGDVKYHDAIDAYEMGLPVMDITHYAGEIDIVNELKRLLEAEFKEIGDSCEIVCSLSSRPPFQVLL